jgi:hypothetical protein
MTGKSFLQSLLLPSAWLLASCTSGDMKLPEEFVRHARTIKLQVKLEWGSLKAIESEFLRAHPIKIGLGSSTSSGFGLGKYFQSSSTRIFNFEFRATIPPGLSSTTICDVQEDRNNTRIGKVGATGSKKQIQCTVKSQGKTYKVQMSSSGPYRINAGKLVGEDATFEVVPVYEDTDGTEHYGPIGWKIVRDKKILGVLDSGFEPNYLYNDASKTDMLLTATTALIIYLVDYNQR